MNTIDKLTSETNPTIIKAAAQELLSALWFTHSTDTNTGFEFYHNPVSRPIEKSAINKIAEYLSDPAKPEFGSGMQSKIYKIKIWNQIYVIAKKRLDNNLKDEIEAQQKMYDIIKKAWLCNQIVIPEIHGCYNNSDDNAIVMEYLPGKTLFHLKAEKVLGFIAENTFWWNQDTKTTNKEQIDGCSSDKDMRSLIQKIAKTIPSNAILDLKSLRNKTTKLKTKEWDDSYPFAMTSIIHNTYLNLAKAHFSNMKLFDDTEADIVKNLFTTLLNLMKTNNFVHWDLNPNNIMYIPKEKKRAIIDFGLSAQYQWEHQRDTKFFQDSFHSTWI